MIFSVGLINGQSTPYDLVESNSGIGEIHKPNILEPIANSIKTLVSNFEMLGCDFYPTLLYAQTSSQIKAYEEDFNLAVNLMDATKDSYVMITKETYSISADVDYRVEIKFPETGYFLDLDMLEKESIITLVKETIENEKENLSSSVNQSSNVEAAGLRKLCDIFKDIVNNSFEIDKTAMLELAGFKEINLVNDGSYNFTANNCNTPYEGEFVNDYACIGYNLITLTGDDTAPQGQFNSVLLREIGFQEIPALNVDYGFSSVLTMTSFGMPDFDNRLNTATSKFESSEKNFSFWLHLDISGSEAKVFYKAKLNTSKAEAIIDDLFDVAISQYSNTENFVSSTQNRSNQNGAYDCSQIGCSLAKWRAYCCIVAPDANTITLFNIPSGLKMQIGVAAGVLDGIIEIVSFAKIIGGGVAEAYFNTPGTLRILGELIYIAYKEQSLWKAFEIKTEETEEFLSGIINSFNYLYNNAGMILGKFWDSIWKSIKGFFNDLNPLTGLATTGYSIGKVVFDILIAYFTGETSLAVSTAKNIASLGRASLSKLKNLDAASIGRFIDDGLLKVKDEVPKIKDELVNVGIRLVGCFVKDTPMLVANKNYNFNNAKFMAMVNREHKTRC